MPRLARHALSCTLLLLLALSLTVIGATTLQPTDHHETVFQHLLLRRNETPVTEFTGQDFKYFVNNPFRNYSLFVLFLSREKTGEDVCEHYLYEFSLVANSYIGRYADREEVFFALVDIDLYPGAGPEDVPSYQTPPLAFIPVDGKDAVVVTAKNPWSAEEMAQWAGRMLRRKVFVQRPGASWTAWLMKVLLVAACLYIHRETVVPFLRDENKMAVAAMIFCFVMSSGQMYNLIEGVGMFGDSRGFVGLFTGYEDSQTVAETILVMLLYAGISLSFIAITDFTQGVGCRTYCNVVAFVAAAAICLLFSVLLWMIRRKVSEYHIGLLF